MDGAERLDGAERVARARASGRCSFLGMDLALGPGSEVPSHESEVLARAVIAWLGGGHGPSDPWIVDARCGIAHLACALAIAVPDVRVWACDRDEEAVRSAEHNVRELGLARRVEVRRGDVLTASEGLRLEGRVHAIVCSPPATIERNEWYAFHACLLEQGADLLRMGGRAYVEVDPAHPDRLRAIARTHASYEWLDFARDEAGRPCAAILRRVPVRHGPRIPKRETCATRTETGFVTTRPRA